MTITNVKAMMAKVATVGLVAGAMMIAAPTKAQAQVRFGVQIGGPVYEQVRPVYGRPVYERPGYGYYDGRYEFARQEAFERREAIERHEAFERARERARWERRRDGYEYYGR